MRGDSGVAGEGRVVGVPKFHSWGNTCKCTMPLTNINQERRYRGGRGGLSPPPLSKAGGLSPPKKADWVNFFYQR